MKEMGNVVTLQLLEIDMESMECSEFVSKISRKESMDFIHRVVNLPEAASFAQELIEVWNCNPNSNIQCFVTIFLFKLQCWGIHYPSCLND